MNGKFKLFALLAIPMLMLASCKYLPPGEDIPINPDPDIDNPGGGDEGEGEGEGEGDNGGEEGMPISVYYFTSAAYVDFANPFYLDEEAHLGGKLTKPTDDPDAPDGAFTTFLGWSSKPLIMSEADLWDFENDRLPENTAAYAYVMYGQWA